MGIVWSCTAGYEEAFGDANGAPGGTGADAVLTLADDHFATKNREIIM